MKLLFVCLLAFSSHSFADAGSGGTGEFKIQGTQAKALFEGMANNGFDLGDGPGYVDKKISCTVKPNSDGKISDNSYVCQLVDPTTYHGVSATQE